MRKYFKLGLCGAAALMLLVSGCSGKKGAEDSSQAESTAAENESAAGETEEYVAESSITLGEYKGIPVTVTEPVVTDEEVEAQIQQFLNSNAKYLEVDREAQLGDQLNIDYKGTKDGVAFDGGSYEGWELILGSNSFIDGFETGLVGTKKGEQVSLDLTFPEEYSQNPDLAGQAVVFEVKVNNIKERTVPELTDEVVAELSPEDGTVEKLRESARANILLQKQYQIDNQRDLDIMDAIGANSEIVYGTDELNEKFNEQLDYLTSQISMYGMDIATYASVYGMDEESFKSDLKDQVRDSMKQQMILEAVAKKENLEVTDEDRKTMAENAGIEDLDNFIATYGQEDLDNLALWQKTLDFLADNAVITVASAEEVPAS